MHRSLLATVPLLVSLVVGCKGKAEEPHQATPSAEAASTPAKVVAAPAAKKSPQRWDGPLGVKMGLTKEELEAAGIPLAPVDNVPLLYRAASAPGASGSFDDYLYYIGDETGLCRIAAWTPARDVNQFGEQLVSTFDELQAALSEKYGRPKEYKFVQRGSIWNEPRDFMMGLLKEERSHAAAWTQEPKRELPADVETILLSATAFNTSRAAVKLTYEFTNADACTKEAKRKKHANL